MANIVEDATKSFSNAIFKVASVQATTVTDEELAKINKFTLEPLEVKDVFAFKVAACDNELDDRNYEPFNLKSLKDLKKLYVGKTVIKDHSRRADNQIARVYDAELIPDAEKVTGAGEVHNTLILKCYMVKTSKNADLITEIKAGIKKEVSTGAVAKKVVCSICGTDNRKQYCPHYWGHEYDGKTCYFTLDGVKDVYELSFVAVPAQPRAGAVKHYKDPMEETVDEEPSDGEKGAKPPETGDREDNPTNENEIEEKSVERLAQTRIGNAFCFVNTNKEVSENE